VLENGNGQIPTNVTNQTIVISKSKSLA